MHGDLAKLVSEVEEIAKLVGPVTFIACDAVVHAVETVHSAQDVAANLKGGGGTSMVPAFAVAKKRKPSLIICITDGAIGHTPKPDEIPVIWCLTQDYRHDVAQSEKDGWSTIVECW
jgi:predicted metal-dependent peptidase